ncbi:nicotinate-nucleotide adenylyltransferase [uncultured Lamprocystis sp.]|jgi:nicotinate-nucleotide adenylyltransferase|uniref:nicotinate-nucleotide adenylyltransferase n=1 Tax=uncultured Lamprocystis sp. TaxID=543132 RepID=UPI0025F0906A|nr:nicotinate-nucleotide adenylyltransferase [uncultured Lamprocystis sp.]
MIGILGGTFDPIHLGHLRPALDCLESLRLDQVRFIPLNVAVHRPQPEAPAALRLAMLKAAIANQPEFVADTRELERPGESFSYDTLQSLRAELGAQVPICLLVGGDAFRGFLDWYRPREILNLAHLVVMHRPGVGRIVEPRLQTLCAEHRCAGPHALRDRPAGSILFQEVTQVAIASTRIRELMRQGLSPRYLVPDPVLGILREAGLYRESA